MRRSIQKQWRLKDEEEEKGDEWGEMVEPTTREVSFRFSEFETYLKPHRIHEAFCLVRLFVNAIFMTEMIYRHSFVS